MANIQALKTRRGVKKGLFTKEANQFSDFVKDNPTCKIERLEYLYKSIEEKYKILEQSHMEYLEGLGADEPDEAELDYMDTPYNLKESVDDLMWPIRAKNVDISNNKNANTDTSKKSNDAIKVDKISFGKFNGKDLRYYFRWRQNMIKSYLPKIPDNDKAVALRSQLIDDAEKSVQGIKDNLVDLWSELDSKYGNKRKISGIIVNEITSMRKVEDNSPSFVKFVEILKVGYQELGQFGSENDLNNSHMISIIERKLPPKIKAEWCEIVTDTSKPVKDDDVFDSLLSFLRKKATAVEYQIDPLRVDICTETESTSHFSGASESMGASSRPYQSGPDSMSKSTCLIHLNAKDHTTEECRAFFTKLPFERKRICMLSKACFLCLARGHTADSCRKTNLQCYVPNCTGRHHGLLHMNRNSGGYTQPPSRSGYAHPHVPPGGYTPRPPPTGYTPSSSGYTPTPGMNAHIPTREAAGHYTGTPGGEGKTILPMQSISVGNGVKLVTLHDSASSTSLILNSVAKSLRLKCFGEVSLTITKTGNVKQTVQSKFYGIDLESKDGHRHAIFAYGLNEISSNIDSIALDSIAKQLDVPIDVIDRPTGKVEMLIGSDFASLHPIAKKFEENLVLGENQFGHVIWGRHPCIDSSSVKIVHVTHNTVTTLDDFLQVESMGVECTPLCGNCRCGKCPLGAKNYTIKEEKELQIIKNNLWYDRDHWVSGYHWVRDPNNLQNNYKSIFAQLLALEALLMKNPILAAAYRAAIQDMLDRGVLVKLTWEEMKSYKGPVFYLGHSGILKLSSTSTPLRIVLNPAKMYLGFCLNDYWSKGANVVQSLFCVTLRLREFEVAIIGDISKMYHSVYTTPLEWHTHRILWRDLDQSKSPEIYMVVRNSFGDKPAGTIATMAIVKTVETFGEEYPVASDALLNAMYVDDICDSQPSMDEAIDMIKQTEQLLKKGGFAVKGWTLSKKSGENDHNIKFLETDKVLGTRYDHAKDEFYFEFHPDKDTTKNIYGMSVPAPTKSQAAKDTNDEIDGNLDGPALKPGTTSQSKLSMRMLLSWTNGIFDILGLASPFVIRAKMVLRKVSMHRNKEGKKLGWDDAIPEHLRDEWLLWMEDAVSLENIKFRRCISPTPLPVKSPMLVSFSDASEQALGCVSYLRWELSNGTFSNYLVAAKSRLAPLEVKTIVRLELVAAVMSKRLASSISKSLRIPIEKTMFIIDSEIVRAMISKESYGFNTFVAVRVGEIQRSTSPDQWFWLEGKSNIADWISRGKNAIDLGPESEWQRGPEFMYRPVEEWTVKQSCVKVIPKEEVKREVLHTKVKMMQKVIQISKIIEITDFSSLYRLCMVTARILALALSKTNDHGVRKHSMSNLLKLPNVECYEEAKRTWIREAQSVRVNGKSLVEKREEGLLANLVTFFDDRGILRARGRVFSDEKSPVLLPEQHPLSRLIVQEVHDWNHDGISTVACKVRQRFWILGVHKIAKSVRHHCSICKKDKAETVTQVMSDLQTERTSVAAPFQFVAIDLFGPFELKLPGRTTRNRKCIDEKMGYGVLFNCLSSRAVYVDLARGYDMHGFLMVYRRFNSIRGDPDMVYSDSGSQLKAADKFLHKLTIDKWDHETLVRHGVKVGTEWKFTSPDAPWQNGISESLIKGVKRSLQLTLRSDHPKLTYDELQTVMFEVANTMNERPIGRHPTSPDECEFLRPNDLLLGRSSTRIRSGPWEVESACPRRRFLLVQKIINDWYARWYRDYFPTLVPRRTWHTQNREICVGDVVMVKDSNNVRGQWTIGQVEAIHGSADGRDRNVDIRYKVHPPQEAVSEYAGTKSKIMRRAVQRLVVICPVSTKGSDEKNSP